MEHLCKISFDIVSTNPASALEFEVWMDNDKILDTQVVESRHVEHRLLDDDGEHELRFVLKNKKESDTVIDEQGNIVQDSVIMIENLQFDDIDLGYIFNELAVYTHNHNGQKESTTEQFFGTMGCNGTVSLRFTTPIYLWLLEHM